MNEFQFYVEEIRKKIGDKKVLNSKDIQIILNMSQSTYYNIKEENEKYKLPKHKKQIFLKKNDEPYIVRKFKLFDVVNFLVDKD